jgi:hypothetical protein
MTTMMVINTLNIPRTTLTDPTAIFQCEKAIGKFLHQPAPGYKRLKKLQNNASFEVPLGKSHLIGYK